MTHPALIGVAAARSASFSMTLLESIEAMALEALDVSPLLADIPVLSGPVEPPRRRRLAFVGIGASGTGTSHRIDELLADGFGRD